MSRSPTPTSLTPEQVENYTQLIRDNPTSFQSGLLGRKHSWQDFSELQNHQHQPGFFENWNLW